ncbi:hypothetical protein [Sphingomonas morindae]|uniref:Uncharacterized protein n=1 Tax=Sphingomonas morindae TaxID=1541170 RepID=A0ABY4X9I2_9SPHN|nr:hypothetical protein [Sphingomonas morindae]USI73568.1 hypothetical protein LHA26_03545 [Sphingomonas morindae]
MLLSLGLKQCAIDRPADNAIAANALASNASEISAPPAPATPADKSLTNAD